MPTDRLRLGVLISGSGRTLRNFIELSKTSRLPAEVAAVISSNPRAGGVTLARQADIPRHVVDCDTSEPEFCHNRIASILRDARVDLVCMAGFLKFWHIPPDFAGRVMNIHPALLPGFGGKGFYADRVHRAVLASGMTETGCTVHFADNEYDHGPIILQRRVPVLPHDTVASLADRVFREELIAYPQAVRLYAAGRLKIDGNTVRVLPLADS